MRRRTLALALTTALLLLAIAAALAVTAPQAVACALVNARGLETLPDGTRVEPGHAVQAQAEFTQLLAQARERIGHAFGTPRAQPIVVLQHSGRAFGILPLNTYGSTSFVGTRACVVIGPQGRNTDVVAHELMHAELFERVGSWQRWRSVPAWFDEGLAMQVDHRPAYALPAGTDTAFARRLHSERDFFAGPPSDAELTRRYAAAKAEVGHWLALAGREGVYARLERLRQGAPFDEVVQAPR